MNTLADLKTDAALLMALEKSSTRKQTADEIREQRVSFIYGAINNKTDVTRSRIQEVLAEQQGIGN